MQAQIKSLNKFIDIKSEEKGPAPYIFPFSKIEKASEFQLELSKWYFENKRYGYGYICLVESILTKLCEVYNLNLRDFKNRERMKDLIYKGISKNIKDFKELANKYKAVNKIRNRIAHASFYEDKNYPFTTDIDQAMNNYEDIKKLLQSKEINQLNNIIPLSELDK